MNENKGKSEPQGQPNDEQDVEGHLMINPVLAGDLARTRSKEIERAARERNRAKEAKR